MTDEQQLELQIMGILENVATWGYSFSNKVGMEEFIALNNAGAIDHQQAAAEVMTLIREHTAKHNVGDLVI